jgi:hypothetical protein
MPVIHCMFTDLSFDNVSLSFAVEEFLQATTWAGEEARQLDVGSVTHHSHKHTTAAG